MGKYDLTTTGDGRQHLPVDLLFLFSHALEGILPGSGSCIAERPADNLLDPLVDELVYAILLALEGILENLSLYAKGIIYTGELLRQADQIDADLLVKVLIQMLKLRGFALFPERIGQIQSFPPQMHLARTCHDGSNTI